MFLSAAAPVLRPLIRAATGIFHLVTKPDWQQSEKLPRAGAVIVANHISHVDPLVIGAFMVRHQVLPLFLAKASLFEVPILGSILRGARQIPVRRQSLHAGDSLDAAAAAIEQGGCVVFYPEGTISRDPELWPMRGKTGAARVALRTGCPVIPIGQWGAEQILRGTELGVPRLCPRKRVSLRVGDPVSLDDLSGTGNQALSEATERIMAAITGLVAELRSESAPAVAYDPGRPDAVDDGKRNGHEKESG